MTAADTIAGAIAELERLRDKSTRGPWSSIGGDLVGGVEWVNPYGGRERRSIFTAEGGYVAGEADNSVDAELIATLYRTIDAQLTILRHDRDLLAFAAANPARLRTVESALTRAGDLALALAILGGDS